MKTRIENKLQHILDKSVDNRKVFGTSFCVQHKDFYWSGVSGNLSRDDQYFIASTTKLFVTAIILQYREKGLLHLEDAVARYLNPEIMQGLHILNGQEYSGAITIRHLLAHTSGIPDYFQQKNESGSSLEKDIVNGNDQSWTFEKILVDSKSMKPLFVPGAKGKAHYSDTNFQLLGSIIEEISGRYIGENFETFIFSPLRLRHTYLYSDVADDRPKDFYYKDRPLHIPKAMTSFGADGGIVSTSEDLMIFIKAFFKGGLFSEKYITELQQWNSIFFPMRSGIGIHLFKLPWIFNPLGTIPALIGHSGLSGTLAYGAPDKELYITGTVNQVAYTDTSFKTAIKLMQELKTA